jgi:hypothetical protein
LLFSRRFLRGFRPLLAGRASACILQAIAFAGRLKDVAMMRQAVEGINNKARVITKRC